MTPRKRYRILARDNFTCQYCGRSAPAVELEVDHIFARSLGGGDEESNLTTACRECNRGKHADRLESPWPKPIAVCADCGTAGLSFADRCPPDTEWVGGDGWPAWICPPCWKFVEELHARKVAA